MSALTASDPAPVRYDPDIEAAVESIERLLSGAYPLGRRSIALLLLQDDPEIASHVRAVENGNYAEVQRIVHVARSGSQVPLEERIALQRAAAVQQMVGQLVRHPEAVPITLGERLSRLCTSPITGLPILAAVLWFGLYQFVGVFGGGTLVGLLEEGLFGEVINPWITELVRSTVPWVSVQNLLVGEYGIWTLGVTYAVALIFPVVGTFFLAFSVLEDSGYFPRLALLIDRLFKRIGLNGKAVIPIVLGFGCDTMATIVTRILETRRERIIATFLLALAIPCSAQIGVMTALLGGRPAAFGLWVGILALVFLLIGWLTARLLPGETARFALELPPLRWPSPGNVLVKTYSRMQWYFLEVFPLFVVASVLVWLGDLVGLFPLMLKALAPITALLGLPPAAAEAFLFGFLRRDYGAAGLYRLNEAGQLDPIQILVSVVTLTLFLPCIAQFLVMKKERGLPAALLMTAFVLPFAVAVGAVLNVVLRALHVSL